MIFQEAPGEKTDITDDILSPFLVSQEDASLSYLFNENNYTEVLNLFSS